MLPRRLIFLIPIAFMFTACGSEEKKPPTVGETRDFAAVCDKANEGKRVAVVGYLRLPDELDRKSTVVLRLFPSADFSGQPVGVSSFPFGKEAQQIEFIPKDFSDKDLKVHTADGQVATSGTKVKVSGDVYYPTVGQTFQCALSNPLVELAK